MEVAKHICAKSYIAQSHTVYLHKPPSFDQWCMHFVIYSTFSDNHVSVTEVEADNFPRHAAISSFRFPLRFTGINQLLDNVGGGLSVMGTVVRVDGSLLVHNNTASYGGGIYLEDLCLVWPCLCLLYVCSGCRCALVVSLCMHVCMYSCMQ